MYNILKGAMEYSKVILAIFQVENINATVPPRRLCHAGKIVGTKSSRVNAKLLPREDFPR